MADQQSRVHVDGWVDGLWPDEAVYDLAVVLHRRTCDCGGGPDLAARMDAEAALLALAPHVVPRPVRWERGFRLAGSSCHVYDEENA